MERSLGRLPPPKKSVNKVSVQQICVVRSDRVYFKSKIFSDGPTHFNVTTACYNNKEVANSNLKPGKFLLAPQNISQKWHWKQKMLLIQQMVVTCWLYKHDGQTSVVQKK